jgi:hypothetical protein
MRRAAAIVALVAATVGALASCSSGGGSSSTGGAPTTASADAFTAVSLGDEATLPPSGDDALLPNQTWPQQFFRTALPPAARFVNLATGPVSTADVLDSEAVLVPILKPKVAVVMLGFDDLARGIAPADFGEALNTVLAALHRDGVARVLVATLPTPAGAITPYNDRIRAAVSTSHDVLVDLEAVGVSGAVDPTSKVFFADATGHLAIGRAFTAAYRAAYPAG